MANKNNQKQISLWLPKPFLMAALIVDLLMLIVVFISWQAALIIIFINHGLLAIVGLIPKSKLLAALLFALESYSADLPKNWQPPQNIYFTGIELMTKDVERSKNLQLQYKERINIINGDIRNVALTTGGQLLLRVGDKSAGMAFLISKIVDFVVNTIRCHRFNKLFCRSLEEWGALLVKLGFEVTVTPVSDGTPFANVLLHGVKR